jgi:hypothetical protein
LLDPVPFLYGKQICYHVINKYRYADSNDVKSYRQALR